MASPLSGRRALNSLTPNNMAKQFLVCILAAVAIAVAVGTPNMIFMPCIVAGLVEGLVIEHRPYLSYLKRSALVAAAFASVLGVLVTSDITSRDSRAYPPGVFLIFFLFSLVPNALGLGATFLIKEIGSHVRGAFRDEPSPHRLE